MLNVVLLSYGAAPCYGAAYKQTVAPYVYKATPMRMVAVPKYHAPTYTAPTYAAPSYAVPATGYAAPVPVYAAPAPAYVSTPSYDGTHSLKL